MPEDFAEDARRLLRGQIYGIHVKCQYCTYNFLVCVNNHPYLVTEVSFKFVLF